MERWKTLRNVAIVLVIAAAVYVLPGGGRAAITFESALWAAFGIGIGYLGLRLYREHRVTLYGLGDRYRGLLYAAIALGAIVILTRERLWQTGLGELVWFALIALMVYALLVVYRRWRSY
jgi:hypothetical protein